jgi:dihydropteroate synthase
MGVVNVTPDSFFPGSRRPDREEAVRAALDLVEEGADIIDIGGESTRPGAEPPSQEEEVRRVVPVISSLRPLTEAIISVDTRHALVAELAIAEGADIVNDVSALAAEPEMASLVAASRCGLVLMHMKGTPETMQQGPHYDDVVREVRDRLAEAVESAAAAGVGRESIAVDPGIGFGKTAAHNLTLLNRLDELAVLERPILVGTSRKSFLGRILSDSEADRLMATAASVACAILRGAHMVRVHDVSEMRQVALVADAIRNEGVAAGALP